MSSEGTGCTRAAAPRMKHRVKRLLSPARDLIRMASSRLEKFGFHLRASFTEQESRTLGVSWINPNELKFWATSPFIRHLLVMLREGQARCFSPFIVGGEWDRERISLEDMDSHHAFYLRYSGELPWRQTAYYKRIAETHNSGRAKGGSASIDEWEERILGIYDDIYASIKKEGFKTQEEIGGEYGPADEIAVAIDRDGEYLFLNGKHRLAISKALRLDEIPVVVIAIHRIWHDRDNGKLSRKSSLSPSSISHDQTPDV